MGNDVKRWSVKRRRGYSPDVGIHDNDGRLIATVFTLIEGTYRVNAHVRAADIVQACNAHDALVAAASDVLAQLKFAHGIGTEKATIKSVKALRIACNEAQAALALATEKPTDATR